MSRSIRLSICVLALSAAGCATFTSPHRRGERSLRRGDYQAAVAAYTEAIAKGEFVAVAYANRCYAFQALGTNDGALRDCTTALDLMGEPDPADAEAVGAWAEVLNNRAVTYISLRQYEDAVADLERAIAARPNYAAAYANLGRVRVEQEDFDQAIADLDKALEIDPNLTEAWGNKAQALTGKGDVEGALDAFGRAIEASGGNPDLYFNRASLLYATGNFKEALADYRVAAKSSNEQLAWMAEQQVNFLKNVEEQPASTATPGGAATATAAAATP